MYKAEISITAFKLIGIWPPESSQGILTIYNIFSICIVSLTYAFTASTVIYLFRGNLNMEEFTESLFYVLALLAACVKMATVFLNRNKIIEITDILLNKQYEPQDFHEFDIQSKFDKIGRTGTIVFIVSVIITVIARSIVPLAKGVTTTLPYKAWVPYNLDNSIKFWLTFLHQSLGSMIAGQATVAGDTFAVVMMLQLCAQMEILMHRIELIPQQCKQKFLFNPQSEQIIFKHWIQHHNSLYLFKNKLNDVFNIVFFFQLFSTTLDVCTSTYLLATFSVTSIKFWSMIFSLGCVMFQISLYCWHGNMVIEKSKAIEYATFSIDWISLSKRSRSNLLYIMKRSNKAMTFTAGSTVTLSLDTFSTILRVSYSMYNCMMQS